MSNESKPRESIRPEIPAELAAVDTLLGLARAFLPSFELPSLAGQSYGEQVGSTAETRFFKPEARYQVLLEQLPAVTFMAVFEEEGLREIYVSPQIETLPATRSGNGRNNRSFGTNGCIWRTGHDGTSNFHGPWPGRSRLKGTIDFTPKTATWFGFTAKPRSCATRSDDPPLFRASGMTSRP